MLDGEGIQLRDILCRAVGPDRAGRAYDAMCSAPSVSVRVNPFKVSDPGLFAAEHFGCGSSPVQWSRYGFILDRRPQFTLDPLFHCGCYYVQDSSAMAVGHVARESLVRIGEPGRPVRVLDLCAAPGGKTTDLAASLRERYGDGFVLVANEVMKNRASVLADNVAVWGDPNVIVTSVDPKAFASLKGFFDMIVADVPCSGEGMFRKEEAAVEDWSEAAVDLCASRQRRIVADVWPSLRQGGILVYSTCTFEKAENDTNVEWIASELGGTVLGSVLPSMEGVIPTGTGSLLVPGFVKGEGQFVAALEKTAPEEGPSIPRKSRQKGSAKPSGNVQEKTKGGLLIHVPASISDDAGTLEVLHPLMCGVAQGTVKGRDLVPSADLALSISLGEGRFQKVELDRATALKFLHRDTIVLDGAPRGFLVVCHEGHPLGFVKNLGNRCNNLHPQERRIRMDINEQ